MDVEAAMKVATSYQWSAGAASQEVAKVLVSEVTRLRADNEKLRAFANALIDAVEWFGDFDGGTLQQLMVEAGLLVETRATEPCSEHCKCAEYYGTDEKGWLESDVICYRKTEVLRALQPEPKT